MKRHLHRKNENMVMFACLRIVGDAFARQPVSLAR